MVEQAKILHYETVTPLLKQVLEKIMAESLFELFQLVGGTNLSLRFGHRMSDDIDLFTDAEYNSLDFTVFEAWLKRSFPYYECNDNTGIVAFGRGYYVGNSATDCVKVDLMYTDPFIEETEIIDGIRLASVDDIVAMKMDVISRGGRKKDFWDLHLLSTTYSLKDMLNLHSKRYEWGHNQEELLNGFTDFEIANELPDPKCCIGKNWDDIKLDLIEIADKAVL